MPFLASIVTCGPVAGDTDAQVTVDVGGQEMYSHVHVHKSISADENCNMTMGSDTVTEGVPEGGQEVYFIALVGQEFSIMSEGQLDTSFSLIAQR